MKVKTTQLRKKLIMQGEVKIAVSSKQVQHSASVSQSLQTHPTFYNTSMHAINKQCIAFPAIYRHHYSLTAILHGKKTEAYTLTAG